MSQVTQIPQLSDLHPSVGQDLPLVTQALERFEAQRPELVDHLNQFVPDHVWKRAWRAAFLKGLYLGRKEVLDKVTQIGGTIDGGD